MVSKIELFSTALDMSCEISVIGPKLINNEKPFNTVYLLHGLTGNNSNWLNYTRLTHYARESNTLFTMPNAGRSWYTDMRYGQKYFTFITQELPEICKSLFNISSKREHTAIMGNSMGGYGALKCALTHPESYGLCCAFSPAALYWQDYFKMPNCQSLLEEFKGIFGTELNVSPENEIMPLAEKAQLKAERPIIRTYCGTEDFLFNMNCRFAQDMQKLNFNYKHKQWSGEHDWIFWDAALQYVIKEFGC